MVQNTDKKIIRSYWFVLLLLGLSFIASPVLLAETVDNDELAVRQVLDSLHLTAANADGEEYFSHYHQDAIYMGTDSTERWTIKEFKSFAEPYFSQGKGWSYQAIERNIYFSPDKKTAWFDESLTNENYGQCRGTGVLIKTAYGWKIYQYNLSIPIPNSVVDSIVKIIKEPS